MSEPYITVTSGMRGFFPVFLKRDREHEFYAPYMTGETCKDFDAAEIEAKEWAEAEGIEYRK